MGCCQSKEKGVDDTPNDESTTINMEYDQNQGKVHQRPKLPINFHEHLSCTICRNPSRQFNHNHSSCTICQQVILSDMTIHRIKAERSERRKMLRKALKGKLVPFPYFSTSLKKSMSESTWSTWKSRHSRSSKKSKQSNTSSKRSDPDSKDHPDESIQLESDIEEEMRPFSV